MSADSGIDPVVDMVIAVHNPQRPVRRAVASVLGHTRTPIRVTVVCHDTPVDGVREVLGELVQDGRLRLVEHRDGIRSPSGPFNRGLDEADAPFVSIMGSDDTLEPGAIDSWVAKQRRDDADVVITRLRHAAGAVVPTPPVRPRRTSSLDGRRDRLAYRSAPLGLLRRSSVEGVRLAVGAPVGGDISFVLALWFSERRISFDRSGPAYVIGADAADRVTFEPKPVLREFTYLDGLLADPWFQALEPAARASYAVKFLRVQVFGAVHNRPASSMWTPDQRADLRTVTQRILATAPRAADPLSIADRRVLDAVLDVEVPAEELLRRSVARRRFRHPAALVPRSLRSVLHREAPLRFMVAAVLSRA